MPWTVEDPPEVAPVGPGHSWWPTDDHPIGTLDELKARVRRRVVELRTADLDTVAGAYFRHLLDQDRLGEFIGFAGADGAESPQYEIPDDIYNRAQARAPASQADAHTA